MEVDSWLAKAEMRLERMPEEAKEIRQAAMDDLFFFAQLMNPNRMYGDIHRDVYRWLQGEQERNQLLLLPRAHMKSHCIAVWCAWWITKYPETTILYLSATAELAEKQLYDIKNILTSPVYTRYFPNMIHTDEGRREKWAVAKIAVDHPQRKAEAIRDWTIATAGLTTNTTGWHADVIVADDVVVPDNAYTEDGRKRVTNAMSQMTSIRNAGGFTKACGTRYHPADIYAIWKRQMMAEYDEETQEQTGEQPVWDIKEHVVEQDGEFLWPRTVRTDGKAFGFSLNVLARIKAEYEDITQYFAQYYNDPNDPSSRRITTERFQYFEPRFVRNREGTWYYKEWKLNVYAAIDFAFSLDKKADFSAIVVIGIDSESNIYVLDIARFKTDRTIEYFQQVARLHSRWGFRKLRAEVTVAQQIIVNDLKNYMRQEGMRVSVDEHRPNRHEGRKEERMASVLEHRYENQKVWHFQGGYTPVLEDELIMARPPHDDVKDALTSAIEIAVKPRQNRGISDMFKPRMKTHSKFGGIAFS